MVVGRAQGSIWLLKTENQAIHCVNKLGTMHELCVCSAYSLALDNSIYTYNSLVLGYSIYTCTHT